MSATAMHPLAADYLRRLRQAGRHLPAGRLDDLCAEVESHLAEAIAPWATDAEALTVLERLGPPGEIVEAEQPPPETSVENPRTWREWTAIVLLPLGGFAFGIGWLIGLIMLLQSRAWTIRDKLIGALIVPGGIALALPLLQVAIGTQSEACSTTASGHMHCLTSGGPSTWHDVVACVVLAVAVVGPIVTAIYLARRARPAAAGAGG